MGRLRSPIGGFPRATGDGRSAWRPGTTGCLHPLQSFGECLVELQSSTLGPDRAGRGMAQLTSARLDLGLELLAVSPRKDSLGGMHEGICNGEHPQREVGPGAMTEDVPRDLQTRGYFIRVRVELREERERRSEMAKGGIVVAARGFQAGKSPVRLR